jgi:hypothetical protein
VVEKLEELRIEYLEAELYIARVENGDRCTVRGTHDNVYHHTEMISDLIGLFKSICKPDNHSKTV